MTAVEAARMPKNLLLADDSKTIQQAVSLTFAREGMRVVAVADGEAALQAARQERPDLILADVSMPRLGGYELCQKLRADAGLKDVPVLLLGGGSPVDPSRAMAVGANGLMPKPFDSGKLIEQVKQILANPKAKATSAPPPAAKTAAVTGARPAPPSTPPKAPSPPSPAGATNVMARPPALASKPPAPPAQRPAGAGSLPPPTAKPPMPGAKSPSAPPPPPSRPAAGPAAKAPAAATGAARPAPPLSRPPPPPSRPAAPSKPSPQPEEDEEIPLDEELAEDSAAPTPLRPVSTPPASSKPSLSVVPARGKGGDGGEAALREALSKASREVIEKIAWEVVPELAETIIREELERLIKERGA